MFVLVSISNIKVLEYISHKVSGTEVISNPYSTLLNTYNNVFPHSTVDPA